MMGGVDAVRAWVRWAWHAYVLGHNAFPAADTYYCAHCTKEWAA